MSEWSFLTYVVDLGDRHLSNILITENFKIVHVDFEYIFSIGKGLPFPEWVPFRLTKGLVNQMSIIEPFGLFFLYFVKSAKKYKENPR